jgi:diguanylate cyclase (GGDEF)-like protein/PAS domain S-box-containing protein
MKLPRPSPIVRISIGLVLITLSLMFSASFLGFAPDPVERDLSSRKSIAETLAVQLTLQGRDMRSTAHRELVNSLVKRNDAVTSVGLRSAKGTLLVDAGDHVAHWVNVPLGHSTPTHAQVPMFDGNERWGTLEIRFKPLEGLFGGLISPWLLQLLTYTCFAGFFAYWLFMRRTLKELDPGKAAPTRVRSAMDALAEGVMMVDERAEAVLVNEALCERLERSAADLVGRPPSALPWMDPATGRSPSPLPWQSALEHAHKLTGRVLSIQAGDGTLRTFVVNASPILDGKGCARGALVTFDDVTDIEAKNRELRTALRTLETSEHAVRQQNEELERLATRDPMTDCLNRRAFFERFDGLFAAARTRAQPLTCIMTDIDHFKQVNDTHGHAAGDDVIVAFANAIKAAARESDLVCRYGGEEFCVLCPGLDVPATAALAEQIRATTATLDLERDDGSRIAVTASFGVACFDGSMNEPADLVNQADEALYAAKESGRNRVITWDPDRLHEPAGGEDATPDPDTAATPHDGGGQDDGDELPLLRAQVRELQRQVEQRTAVLQRNAGHDRLTRLPDRLLFRDRCEQAIARARRAEKNMAVLSLEVPTLVQIGEALGPQAADVVLKHISERLNGSIRDTDTVALLDAGGERPTLSRLGDREFGLLVTDLETTDALTWLVQRLFDCLSGRIRVKGHELLLEMNVGIAVYPGCGRSPDVLTMNAQAARKHAAGQPGSNRYQFYSREMNDHALRLLEMGAELRKAIDNDELTLHFQPKFSARTGVLTGVEALARWVHPTRGMVSPGEFIPVAEHAGLIAPLGHWVIRRACNWLEHWEHCGFDDLHVAVNVSSLQFREADFCNRVLQTIEEHGISPQRLELELTETSVMDNLSIAKATIHTLSEHGVRIAIDDFGTGYSSLSYLRSFPLDCLKIDRSFLTDICSDPAAEALVATMCSMGHRLGMRVVAEGVEQEQQLRLLRRHRCDEVQGFLFSPAVTGDEITQLALARSGDGQGLRRWLPWRRRA